MKRTHVFLPEPALAELHKYADKIDVPVAELIRRGVEMVLKELKERK